MKAGGCPVLLVPDAFLSTDDNAVTITTEQPNATQRRIDNVHCAALGHLRPLPPPLDAQLHAYH